LLPSLPQGSLLTAVALIGTTIVPYNLFLHAAAARKKWQGQGVGALTAARSDTAVSVGLGGLISVFILVTAAGSIFSAGLSVSNPADFPRALEPAYGAISKYLIGTGLLAAGLSSAITAPMAAGFAVCELASKPAESWLFRVVSLSVLMIGAGIALVGFNPLQVILLAQAANGLLLPIVATFMLITMNRKSLLGDYANGWIQNILGGMVLFITIGLGIRLILRAAGVWP
jgi:Mn2+/Fe2+ NRAMP family transporter